MLLSRCAHLSFNPISLNSQFEVALPYRHTKGKHLIFYKGFLSFLMPIGAAGGALISNFLL